MSAFYLLLAFTAGFGLRELCGIVGRRLASHDEETQAHALGLVTLTTREHEQQRAHDYMMGWHERGRSERRKRGEPLDVALEDTVDSVPEFLRIIGGEK